MGSNGVEKLFWSLLEKNYSGAYWRWLRGVRGQCVLSLAILSLKAATPYEYFMEIFPPDALMRIVMLTPEKLREKGKQVTTGGEILKFFGILILGTRYEFGSRADLWSSSSRNIRFDPPAFGRTGMPRDRFDLLFTLITFSKQSDQGGVSSERHRWQLVDDFVSSINAHREAHVQPTEMLCVDKSISKWNDLGGHWSDIGLPNYIAIDRKPENGCEIQNTACGRSGIILRLQLVTTPEDRKEGSWNLRSICCTGQLFLVALSLRGLAPVVLLQRILTSPASRRHCICAT
jgi:Transposase IS4